MPLTVFGVVREGRVVPDSPLPEGARVEVRLAEPTAMPAELQVEFAAWNQASDRALTLVDELLAKEEATDETR